VHLHGAAAAAGRRAHGASVADRRDDRSHLVGSRSFARQSTSHVVAMTSRPAGATVCRCPVDGRTAARSPRPGRRQRRSSSITPTLMMMMMMMLVTVFVTCDTGQPQHLHLHYVIIIIIIVNLISCRYCRYCCCCCRSNECHTRVFSLFLQNTFRASRRSREMYSVYVSVCLPLPRRIPALLRSTDPDVTWGVVESVPLVVHYWADLQSVHGFHFYDNIAANAKCQRVLVLAHMLGCILFGT